MSINILEFTGLILRFALAMVTFFIAALFYLKLRRAKGAGIDLSPFIGLELFFLFTGSMEILFVYYFYVLFELSQISTLLYISATYAGICGITGAVFFSEKMAGKTKFAFTIYSLGTIVIGLIFFNTVEMTRLFSTITLPISVTTILLIFIYSMIVKTKGEIRRKMFFAILSMLSFAFFYILDTEYGKTLLPIPREVAGIISMSGLFFTAVCWGYIFLSFETLTEFGWGEKMRELFIIAPNGITLFHYSFVENIHIQSSDLVSAGLIGVQAILAEMVQSKQQLKSIDHQDVKILFKYGIYSTVALVASEDLKIFHSKLILLSSQFERLFQDILPHWTGDVEIFLPAKQLIADIFG